LKTQRKKTLDANKATCEILASKIEPTSNSKPHAFTEYLVCMTDKPPQEYDKSQNARALDMMAQEQYDSHLQQSKSQHKQNRITSDQLCSVLVTRSGNTMLECEGQQEN
jgi:hypothetical protein